MREKYSTSDQRRWEHGAVINMDRVPSMWPRLSSLTSQGGSATGHYYHPKFQTRKLRLREVKFRTA